MGYCMDQTDSKFLIKAGNKDAALAAVKALATEEDKMSGGSYQGGETIEKWYGFVDMSFVNAKTLMGAVLCWRWEMDEYENGDVYEIFFRGEKLADDRFLLGALAPFVEAGSFISMTGEDGAHWRWFFDGTYCIEQRGYVVYQ